MSIHMLDDLYRHNDWANRRIFQLCEGLTDAQLDQPKEMGLGSLRATLFHLLEAEQIWLERWQLLPWRPFQTDPQGMSPADIHAKLNSVSAARRELIDQERSSNWQRQVQFQDSKRNEYIDCLKELLTHVANHGTYHRAQALHFLKQFGRTVPVGLDFLVFKLAHPNTPQEPATVQAMRQMGMEVDLEPGLQVEFQIAEIQHYFAYHDWATRKVLHLAETLDDAALDRDFGIGPGGTIRKTLQHLAEVEAFWMKNWSGQSEVRSPSTAVLSIGELKDVWTRSADERDIFITHLTPEQAAQPVTMLVGGPPLKFRITDSLIQICVHGTHHRAQLANMLRHSGVQPPGMDYIAWVREMKP